MSTMIPMFLAVFCAASCTLIDRCRTAARVTCAVAMVVAMLDAAYLHLMPIPVNVTLIAGVGIWAAIDDGHMDGLPLRTFRVLCSLMMGALIFRHAELASIPGEVCTGNGVVLLAQSKPPVFASLGAATLFVAGIAFSAGAALRTACLHGLRQRIAMLEAAFMGLSLILMIP